METDKEKSPKSKMAKILKLFLFIILISFIAASSIVIRNLRPDITSMSSRFPSPPDLRKCTSFEIEYQNSALEYYYPSLFRQNLLSTSEVEYLASLNKIIVNDPKIINVFVDDINRAKYRFEANKQLDGFNYQITCFCNEDILATLVFYSSSSNFITNGKVFGFGPFEVLEFPLSIPEIKPFILRYYCHTAIADLGQTLHSISEEYSPFQSSQWCDNLIAYWDDTVAYGFPIFPEEVYSKVTEFDRFQCLSAGEGKCNYAMNPNYTPDSPDDMVLLFETTEGWNQHGGPELFTFDNHEPRGGCVLLNDGTVKFIRTEEELNALRWE